MISIIKWLISLMISYSIDLFLLSILLLLMRNHQETFITACGDTVNLRIFLIILLSLSNIVFSFKNEIIKKDRTIVRALYLSAVSLPMVLQLLINGAIALAKIPTKLFMGLDTSYIKIEYNEIWLILTIVVLVIVLVPFGSLYYHSESEEECEYYGDY